MTDGASRRVRSLPPYLFARIDEIKREAAASGTDIIDLGVGDPDLGPPVAVLETLTRGVRENGSHHYSSYAGLTGLREAFAAWFEKRHGIALDPESEILPLLGSKEGIGHISLACLDEGDEVLVPDPGYPVYAAGAVLAGARPVYYPLTREKEFLPDAGELAELVTPKTRMIWLNYPSNPTTAMVNAPLLKRIVEFALERGVRICHDMAYSEITFDGRKALSLMEIPGGKEAGIEFHSLSKTFCMPGWRVGFAVGNAGIIRALAKVKTNLDSGIFIPVQEAAITALTECEDHVQVVRRIFEERRNRFVGGLREAGWDVPVPAATFYVWLPVPRGTDSMEFCTRLLGAAGIVSTPGVGFGAHGEGFIRMSLTLPDDRLDEAIARLRAVQ